jgi:hypothetical protein
MPQRGTKSTKQKNMEPFFFCDFCAFLWLPTTDEVNNLDPILIVQHRRTPITATHNFAVEFDRNARGRQLELAD